MDQGKKYFILEGWDGLSILEPSVEAVDKLGYDEGWTQLLGLASLADCCEWFEPPCLS